MVFLLGVAQKFLSAREKKPTKTCDTLGASQTRCKTKRCERGLRAVLVLTRLSSSARHLAHVYFASCTVCLRTFVWHLASLFQQISSLRRLRLQRGASADLFLLCFVWPPSSYPRRVLHGVRSGSLWRVCLEFPLDFVCVLSQVLLAYFSCCAVQ